jgi:hypothetical protein
VTGSSAQASCDSDAKSVEVAVEAYKNFPGNGDQWPAASAGTAGNMTNAALTGNTNGGPYLRTFPNGNSTHYTITNDNGGNVFVTPINAVNGGTSGTAYNYDTTTSGGKPVDPCTYVS